MTSLSSPRLGPWCLRVWVQIPPLPPPAEWILHLFLNLRFIQQLFIGHLLCAGVFWDASVNKADIRDPTESVA